MLWIYFFGARHELRETSVGRIMRCVNSSCSSESMMRVSRSTVASARSCLRWSMVESSIFGSAE